MCRTMFDTSAEINSNKEGAVRANGDTDAFALPVGSEDVGPVRCISPPVLQDSINESSREQLLVSVRHGIVAGRRIRNTGYILSARVQYSIDRDAAGVIAHKVPLDRTPSLGIDVAEKVAQRHVLAVSGCYARQGPVPSQRGELLFDAQVVDALVKIAAHPDRIDIFV